MKRVRTYDTNESGRDFVVGDLYGHTDDFNVLLNHVQFNNQVDRVFATGNLVNCGPNNTEALELIHTLWFDSVLGANESIIERLAGSVMDPLITQDLLVARGGKWMIDIVNKHKPLTLKQISWLFAFKYTNYLPLIIVVGSGKNRFNVVHGELHGTRSRLISDDDIDKWTFNGEEVDRMLWGKTIVNHSPQSEDYFPLQHQLSLTFCGGSVVRVVHMSEAQIFLNTGAHIADNNPELGLTLAEPKINRYWTYHRATGKISTYNLPII